MKKQVYTLIALIFMGLTTMAQNDAISSYFSEYEDREDVITVMLSAKAFELISQVDVDDEEMQEYKDMASGITGLRLIADENASNAKAEAERAIKRLPSKYEELMTVKEKDTHVKMMVDEEAGTVYELVLIAGSEDAFAIVSLTGEMKLSELGKITAQMMQAGSTAFSEMDKLTGDIRIYPNPVKQNNEVFVKLSDDWVGKEIRVFNAAGVEVEAITSTKERNTLSTSDLEPGVYIVKATDGQSEVSGKFIVQR